MPVTKACEFSDATAAAIAPQAVPDACPKFFFRDESERGRFVPVFTLVLWLGCSVVGALGLTLHYSRPAAAKPEPEPLKVEMLNVELSDEPLPDIAPPSPLVPSLDVPPPPEAVVQPQVPPTLALAVPSPAVAFAVPVEAPARIVEARHASYTTSTVTNQSVAVSAPPVQTLTFGLGDGRQPQPEYPVRAKNAGQEGVVGVRFIVAENGRVASAEAVDPSPWPLLNESAVRTIRNRWRFPAGTQRAYEVAIRFVLTK